MKEEKKAIEQYKNLETLPFWIFIRSDSLSDNEQNMLRDRLTHTHSDRNKIQRRDALSEEKK